MQNQSRVAIPDIPARVAIFSLPNELLVEIAAAGQSEDRVPNNDFKSEWTLSHVSSRFRDAVLSAPTLWSFFETNLIRQGSVETMKLYLARSGGCKIRANLCDLSWMDAKLDLIAERLSHILPHTHRISRLSIRATERSIVSILAVLQDAAAPVLQGLEIEVEAKIDNRPLDMFSSGPPEALTFLKTVGFTPQFPLPRWMASLTHLEISRCDPIMDSTGNSVFLDLTLQCPTLIRLYVDTSFWVIRQQRRVIIPSLKTLRLAVNSDANAFHLRAVLGLFDTPALTDLIMDYTHGDQICVLFDSNSLPDSSFPALTSLTFVNSGSCACEDDNSIRQAVQPIPPPPLRLFPTLASLTLVNGCFTSHIVEQILGPASPPFPLLRTVALSPNPTPETFQEVYNTLQTVIASKRQGEQTIPKFRFSPMLFHQPYWDEHGVDVELFDYPEVLIAVCINVGQTAFLRKLYVLRVNLVSAVAHSIPGIST
ncbi:hypothetical protein FB451DRAFT_616069 [Mycena latifolia]|nr:hypothetical protein FB451DRAFT_616069 [Mycena latifolia]